MCQFFLFIFSNASTVERGSGVRAAEMPGRLVLAPGPGRLRLRDLRRLQLSREGLLQRRAIPPSRRPLSALLLSGTAVHVHYLSILGGRGGEFKSTLILPLTHKYIYKVYTRSTIRSTIPLQL